MKTAIVMLDFLLLVGACGSYENGDGTFAQLALRIVLVLMIGCAALWSMYVREEREKCHTQTRGINVSSAPRAMR